MQQSNKSQPIRTCSCAACRAGKRTTRGNYTLTMANRRLRRAGKPAQIAQIADYDNMVMPMVGAGYTD